MAEEFVVTNYRAETCPGTFLQQVNKECCAFTYSQPLLTQKAKHYKVRHI